MTDRSPSRWRALLELLRPDRTRWLALGALVAATSALGLAGPIVLRRIIDQATAGQRRKPSSGSPSSSW
ncbi:MAG: hypothetical protein R2710_13275 [Acidimicrobiales bacterium]